MKEKLEYTYVFANGDTVTLSARGVGTDECEGLSKKWIALLQEMDREEERNDHSETRRHCSIDKRDPNGRVLISKTDGLDELEALVTWTGFCQTLNARDAFIAQKAFIEELSIREIALMVGRSIRRTQEIIRSLRKKYKDFLEKIAF